MDGTNQFRREWRKPNENSRKFHREENWRKIWGNSQTYMSKNFLVIGNPNHFYQMGESNFNWNYSFQFRLSKCIEVIWSANFVLELSKFFPTKSAFSIRFFQNISTEIPKFHLFHFAIIAKHIYPFQRLSQINFL